MEVKKLLINGNIDDDTVSLVHDFLIDVDTDQKILISLDSKGGNPECSLAIHNLLKLYNTKCVVIGYCMSAATDILLACKERLAYKDTCFLIHEVNFDCELNGTKKELSETFKNVTQGIDFLNKFNKKILKEKTKMTKKQINKALRSDFYFSSKKALKLGFVDQVI